MIPFNRPHGFRVVPLKEGGISVVIPYWRINRNHIKGVHACALATAAEMASGLGLLEHLDPRKYRLILRSLRMDYHYQGKERVTAVGRPDVSEIKLHVLDPLLTQDVVDHTSVVELHDRSGHHVATGTATWQVKDWSKVRTKV
jgi:acyl-coenzyme A thioesterase PaaI-like protein